MSSLPRASLLIKTVVAKLHGREGGFEDGGYFLRSLKRERINNNYLYPNPNPKLK
jgi:hypothetical protein